MYFADLLTKFFGDKETSVAHHLLAVIPAYFTLDIYVRISNWVLKLFTGNGVIAAYSGDPNLNYVYGTGLWDLISYFAR